MLLILNKDRIKISSAIVRTLSHCHNMAKYIIIEITCGLFSFCKHTSHTVIDTHRLYFSAAGLPLFTFFFLSNHSITLHRVFEAAIVAEISERQAPFFDRCISGPSDRVVLCSFWRGEHHWGPRFFQSGLASNVCISAC